MSEEVSSLGHVYMHLYAGLFVVVAQVTGILTFMFWACKKAYGTNILGCIRILKRTVDTIEGQTKLQKSKN